MTTFRSDAPVKMSLVLALRLGAVPTRWIKPGCTAIRIVTHENYRLLWRTEPGLVTKEGSK